MFVIADVIAKVPPIPRDDAAADDWEALARGVADADPLLSTHRATLDALLSMHEGSGPAWQAIGILRHLLDFERRRSALIARNVELLNRGVGVPLH